MLKQKLIFVYNADSDVFSQVADFAHKIFSPKTYKCSLCAITHGNFTEKKEWTEFIKTLQVPVEFLHKDEFTKQYGTRNENYPLVLLNDGKQLSVFIKNERISQCKSIEDLTKLVKEKLKQLEAH